MAQVSGERRRAVAPARQRRLGAGRPAPDRRAGNIRDARVDNDAYSVPDGELIAHYHTALLAEGKRPRRVARAKRERPRRLEHRRGPTQPVAADCSGRRGKDGVGRAVA